MSNTLPTGPGENPSTDINSLLNRAKQDFVDSKLSKGEKFDIEDNDFEKDTFDNFLSFLNGRNSYSILATELAGYSDEQKKSIIEQLRQEIIKESVKIDKNIKTLKEQFEEDFKINGGEDLEKKLKKLKISELNPMINSELKRRKFIETNYKKGDFEEIDNSKEIDSFLNQIKPEQPLTEEQQEAFLKLSEGMNTLNGREFLALLFAFSKKDKIKILVFFNNSFNLSDLLEYGIIDKVQTYGLLEKSIKKTYPNLSESEIKKYLPSLEGDTGLLKEINISVKELESMGDKPLEKLVKSEELLGKVQNSLNERIEKELEEGDLNKLISLDSEGNIHNNFKDLIKKDFKNVSDNIRGSIEDFESGNYFKLNLNGKDSYYYIESTDLGGESIQSKTFRIKNLASPFGSGLLKPEHAESELMSYEKLYEVFKTANSRKDATADFINKDEFNKNGEIEINDSVDNISSEKDLKKKLIDNGNLDESLKDTPLTELTFLDDVFKGKDKAFYRSFQAVSGNKLVFDGSNQEMLFSDFYAEIAKNKDKYKFEKKFFGANDITEKEPLSNIAIHKDGKKFVIKSDKNDSNAKEIDYFTVNDGLGAIHIEKISDNGIEYSIGEIKSKTDAKKDKEKKITKTFTSKHGYDGFNQFIYHLKQGEYKPDTEGKTIEKKEDKENEDLINSGGSMAGKIFRNSSVLELIQGGKMLVENIEQHFEHGNKLRAAKFAEKFGKVLPNTISTKLKSKVEKETADLIGERVDMWKVMGSDEATQDIQRNILFNKYAEDHEVVAAMMYMAEKDGGLYAKALVGNQSTLDKGFSSYLWFRKLGGTREMWEEEVKRIQNSEEKDSKSGRPDPTLVSEEKLVMSILKKRANNPSDTSFTSKVHKDFWGKLETGHDKRMEKGVNESASLHTASEKVEYTLNYLSKGEASRFLGAMDKTLGKDSDKYSMNVMPFVLGMSGASRHWHSMAVQKLHQMDGTTAYPTLEMMKTEEGIDLYQEAIYAFLEESGNTNALKKLKTIKSKDISKQISNRNGYDLADFFFEYRDLLTNFITLKDGFASTRRSKKPVLGEYYDRIKSKLKDAEYTLNEDSIKAKTYESSALADSNAKLANNLDIGSHNLEVRGTKSDRLFNVYVNRLEEIKSLPSIETNSSIGVTEKDRNKLFVNVFDAFEEHLSKYVRPIYKRYLDNDDLNTFYSMDVPKKMKKHNLMLSNGTENRENFLNEAYHHFISGASMGNITDEVPNAINDLLEGKVANNPDYEPVENEEVA